jgi:mortality factor 4-like protein 1
LTATVADGLRVYFDKLLPVALLYAFEMPQSQQLPAKAPSQMYGAEHLLRLFGMLIRFYCCDHRPSH